MNLEQLQRRLERVRGRLAQHFPQKETGPDLADLCPELLPEEQLAYRTFVATIRDKWPGGRFTNEALDVALDLMTREEKAEFRRWLVLAEQRKNNETARELSSWRGW